MSLTWNSTTANVSTTGFAGNYSYYAIFADEDGNTLQIGSRDSPIIIRVKDVTPPIAFIDCPRRAFTNKAVRLDSHRSTDDVGIVQTHWYVEGPRNFSLDGPIVESLLDLEGLYNIKLVVIDGSGNMGTSNTTIKVDAVPTFKVSTGIGIFLLVVVSITAISVALYQYLKRRETFEGPGRLERTFIAINSIKIFLN